MTTISRELVADALDNAGIDPDEAIRERYSGRGMMGTECFGVILPSLSQLLSFFVELGQTEFAEDVEGGRFSATAIEMSDRIQQDAMGHSTIYYFPGYTLGD